MDLIVFLAFMMLGGEYVFHTTFGYVKMEKFAPDDSRLDDIFTIFFDSIQDITRFRLNFSLNWLIQIYANLL